MIWKKKKPRLLAAARQAEVLDQLDRTQFEVVEAFSTRGVLEVLSSGPISLVVVDPEDLRPSGGASPGVLRAALNTAEDKGVMVMDAGEFLAAPQEVMGQALLAGGVRRAVGYLPPRVVMVSNYPGGVGKTTLALTLARRFAEVTGLPAAVIEAEFGGSALRARLGLSDQTPSLYSLVTQGGQTAPAGWQGVTLYPLDSEWEAAALAENLEASVRFLTQLTGDHNLVVLDIFPASSLWPLAAPWVTDVIVPLTTRPDARIRTETGMAEILYATYQDRPDPPRTFRILNRAQRVRERIAYADIFDAVVVENPRAAGTLAGSLADPLLALIYPGWRL